MKKFGILAILTVTSVILCGCGGDDSISTEHSYSSSSYSENRQVDPANYNPNNNQAAENAKQESCSKCYGTGNCPDCDGQGLIINPYTGDYIDCVSCKDGICPVCNGKRYV